ncbi:hypothetical protein HH310_40835 [Actinoplanes sp. TBRC 11911]|uniref:hypothetical protein n=1 Tax=Actinoplanes sp. TBRC 11911 TaxID=2729386 RepID=UPI00145ED6EE|nr:hypothetical protein [Actinoplanes sp. TBRC 11911]NMO57504.1 hypothetical protein [Actinoplanes sp. TBRC 11911]
MPARITVDPDTGNLVGQNTTDLYTYAEVRAIRPACPRCGTAVTIQPMDSNSMENRGERRYYVGRHTFNCQCWNR